jgi:hypothetical protein
MPTPNITYFLGAGASANSLPVMNSMERRLAEFHDFLNRYIESSNYAPNQNDDSSLRIDNDNKNIASSLSVHIQWLRNEIAKHQTIDTLARKLYLNNVKKDELKSLKCIMTIFFLYEQSAPLKTWVREEKTELVDKRYDSFIASIINPKKNNYSLPKNIKIITWNYDLQFESAYKEYNTISIPEIQNKLQIIPNHDSNTKNINYDLDKFLMIRLNGVIGLKSFNEIKESVRECYLDPLYAKFNINNLLLVYKQIGLSHYPTDCKNPLSYYNYNWEYDNQDEEIVYKGFEKVRQLAGQIISNTDALVIIGYSFPVFNREYDKELLWQLRANSLIYIQDSDFDAIKSRIAPFLNTSDMVNNISPIKYLNQFYFPNQLVPEY